MSRDIIDVEISPTNIARCRYCRKQIPKGTPRVYYNYSFNRIVTKKEKEKEEKFNIVRISKSLFCYKCSVIIMNEEIISKRQELAKARRITKQLNKLLNQEDIKSLIRDNEILNNLKEKRR